MGEFMLNEKPESTSPNSAWFTYVEDGSGNVYKVKLTNLPGGGGGGDVTAPTIVSAIVTTANQVVVVFSESVTVTTAGWSFRRNTASWAITSVSGSGTTWTFLMATSAVSGETLDRSYNSATGATVDGSANELVSFTNSAVTNSVAGGLVEVNFDTKTAGLTESPANYWDSAVSSTDYGVSDLTMAGDGTFQAEVDGTGNAPICLGNTITSQYFVDGSYFLLEKVCLFVYTGNYYYAEGGAGNVDTGTAASSGHLYRIRRSGSSFIGEYSTNSGVSWTTLRNYSTTQAGTLYLKTSILTASDGIKNPQATGVV